MEFTILSESNKELFDNIYAKYRQPETKQDVIRYVRFQSPVNVQIKYWRDKTKLIIVEEHVKIHATKTGIRIGKTTPTKVIIDKTGKKAWKVEHKVARPFFLDSIPNIWKDLILNFMGREYEWMKGVQLVHTVGYIWKRGYTNSADYYRKENIIRTNVVWSKQDSKKILKVSKNWDFLKTNFNLLDKIPNLTDLVRFANILDEKIDWNWSPKRFQQQHDDWAIQVQNLNILFQEELRVNPVFNKLESDNFVLIQDLKGLMTEGGKQHHCVGTYAPTINQGNTAIFVYKNDWTCQVISKGQEFELKQMKGKFNSIPPDEIKNEVLTHLNSYTEVNDLLCDLQKSGDIF